jgi:polysaccharide pyruvyl transferase WcaK-like protein
VHEGGRSKLFGGRHRDCEWPNAAFRPAHTAGGEAPELGPRIALLTPYDGGNLGDAAIQDAIIANIRLRLPGAQFSGISLNCSHFIERHGVRAFPLCGTDRPFYRMSRGSAPDRPGDGESLTGETNPRGLGVASIERALKNVPGLWNCLKVAHTWLTGPWRELRHCVQGYRFLCMQDLLIVAGGGQLDEEWGGAWGHPFALFKWAVLARFARIPYVMVSVGAQKAESATSRLFMSAALRLATYRSYRDRNSREIAVGLLQRATKDPVVPDLAFTLPPVDLPPAAGFRAIAQDRPTIAISPIAFAKPGRWPWQDRALYDRYLHQMTEVVAQLLKHGSFLVMVCSSLGDDDSVTPELLGRLDDESKNRLALQMYIPTIATWKDVVASLRDVDILIASRLHSTIFGFVTQTPTVAISFDPKVDWVMEDLSQTDYLLQIHNFTAKDVIEALDRIERHRDAVLDQIASYRHRILSDLGLQYDALSGLLMAGRQRFS